MIVSRLVFEKAVVFCFLKRYGSAFKTDGITPKTVTFGFFLSRLPEFPNVFDPLAIPPAPPRVFFRASRLVLDL